MNYNVTRNRQQIGQWFETACAAWNWIERQQHIERINGLRGADYRAYYNPTGSAVDRDGRGIDDTPAPRIEHTEAGAQVVINVTPARTIPAAPLRPRRAQNEAPLELERTAINEQQQKLF